MKQTGDSVFARYGWGAVVGLLLALLLLPLNKARKAFWKWIAL